MCLLSPNVSFFHTMFLYLIILYFSGETATCMYNSPHEDESLPRVLPGKLLSLDAQCRKDRGTSACFKVSLTFEELIIDNYMHIQEKRIH